MSSTQTDFRMALDIRWATRSAPIWHKSRNSSLAAKDGLRYEKKVGKELERLGAGGRFTQVEHNPWFRFKDLYGIACCSPDFLLHRPEGLVIVEVKLTWVDVAIHKLNDLYSPVVSFALGKPCRPLVICRNLTRDAPPSCSTLNTALASPHHLLHWPEIGQIRW